MKSFLTTAIIISILSMSNIYAQDMRAEIGGNNASNGFSVINAAGDTLFRVTGEGNIGFGKGNPEYLLDVFQKFGDVARSINLRAGSRPNSDGGSINLYAGDGGTNGDFLGGEINIVGGDGTREGGGSIHILGGNKTLGTPNGMGGSIFIKSGDAPGPSNNHGGNINIETGIGGSGGGNIRLLTGANSMSSGNILIQTGSGPNQGGSISIVTGATQAAVLSLRTTSRYGYCGDIIIEPGDISQEYSGDGGNIQLNPGLGANGGSNGLVLVNGSGTYTGSWTQASDERFKKNIKPLKNSLEQIEQLNPISYELRKDEFPEKKFTDEEQIGLIAQEVEKVIPVLVKTDSDGYKLIDYSKINVLLIEAIKEQQKSIDELRKEIELLKSKSGTELSSSVLTSN